MTVWLNKEQMATLMADKDFFKAINILKQEILPENNKQEIENEKQISVEQTEEE